jgi:hypothetical protein
VPLLQPWFARLSLIAVALAAPALSVQAQAGEATYEVTFDSTWSAATHPGAFPGGAHYSPLVGAVHSSAVSLWSPGVLASAGMEQMAETGGTSGLNSEVNAAIGAGDALALLSGSGISSPASTSISITVTDAHPLVTLVTMVAPSPDWFVGVHDQSLLVNGRFVDQLVVSLFAYDAGSDDGTDFTSSNQESSPHAPVALITGGPFTGAVPLGTFTFQRSYSSQLYGCGLNPAGSLTLMGGAPRIGQTATHGVHDPTGTLLSPASTRLYGSIGSAPGFPCGLILGSFGLGPTGMSELLIQLPSVVKQAGPSWTGVPAPFVVTIPNDVTLANVTVYAQATLFDGTRLGLTEAVEMRIGL